MKDGFKQIIGKKIAKVLVAVNPRDPRNQMFLVFTDGTSFEIYGNEFNCAGGLDSGGEDAVRNYAAMFGGEFTNVYPDSDKA